MVKKIAQTVAANTVAPVDAIPSNVLTFKARASALLSHRKADSADMRAVNGFAKGASPFHFTQAVSDAIDAWAINPDATFKSPQKPVKRFIQFVHAVNAKDYKQIDIVTASVIYALNSSDKPLNTDALKYLIAGLKTGREAPNTRGLNRTTINRIFGRVGLSTVETQVSRSVGINGFLVTTGAVVGQPGKQNQEITLNREHPMIKAFFATMNAATESQVDEMVKTEGDAE